MGGVGGAALLGAGLLFFLRRRRARARSGPRPTIDWEDGDKHREESVPQEVSPFVSVLASCPFGLSTVVGGRVYSRGHLEAAPSTRPGQCGCFAHACGWIRSKGH